MNSLVVLLFFFEHSCIAFLMVGVYIHVSMLCMQDEQAAIGRRAIEVRGILACGYAYED
jgi:hypothetical protein